MEKKELLKFVLNLSRPPLTLSFSAAILAGTVSLRGVEPVILPLSFFYGTCLCFLAFSLNDYFDREIDEQLGRTGGTKGALIKEKWHEKTVITGSAISIILMLLTTPFLNRLALTTLTLLVILSFAYSAPPLRLKSVPILDSITNGTAAFLMFALGVGLMNGNFHDIIPAGYWGGLIFMPLHAIVSCPDIEADRKNGVKTAGMILGWRGSALWLISVILTSVTTVKWDLIPLLGQLGLMCFGIYIFVTRSEEGMYRFIETGSKIGVPITVIWLLFETGLITL